MSDGLFQFFFEKSGAISESCLTDSDFLRRIAEKRNECFLKHFEKLKASLAVVLKTEAHGLAAWKDSPNYLLEALGAALNVPKVTNAKARSAIENYLVEDPDNMEDEYLREKALMYIRCLKDFLSMDYSPPDDLLEAHTQMGALWLFNRLVMAAIKRGESIPQNLILKIDLVMFELLNHVSIRCYDEVWKADKKKSELDRQAGKDKAGNRTRQLILDEYYRINRKEELSFHAIARIIQDRIKQSKKREKVPGINTIKRYVEREREKPITQN